MDDHTGEIQSMKVAAAALVDLKTYNKGRSLFKRENHQLISSRRAEIMANDPKASGVGAYQTSLKELWEETNQRYWEERAAGESKDIHECVILHFTLLRHVLNIPPQKSAALPKIPVLQPSCLVSSGGIR
jgi:hypothetical protein